MNTSRTSDGGRDDDRRALQAILLTDDLDRELVVSVERPLHPASQRLMDYLGVRVEVVPVNRIRGNTERTHGPDGVKTHSQLTREIDAWRDSQPMLVRCAVHGCDWTFEGPAGEGRDEAATHRVEAHPDLDPVAVRRERQRSQRKATVATRSRSGADALARMDAGERQEPVIEPDAGTIDPETPAALPPVAPEPTPAAPPVIAPATGRRPFWTPEKVRDAIAAKVLELGRVPTMSEWKRENWTPSHVTVRKSIGSIDAFRSFGEAVLAGGAPTAAAAAPTPPAAEPKNELEIIRSLDAEELIVVGRILQAVGSVRALERRERALPLVSRLVDDLHRELVEQRLEVDRAVTPA